MSVLIVGSLALDSVKTPFGDKKDILGGSATHASLSASFFSPIELSGVVGSDFPESEMDFLKSRGINLLGLKIMPGETFRWQGYYEDDMSQAHTIKTELNVYGNFDAEIPEELKESPYLFLANLDPSLQLKVLDQVLNPSLTVMDTMNYWIETKKEELLKVMQRVDVVMINDAEIRQLTKVSNIPLGAEKLLELGVKAVIVKKGEHGALFFSREGHFALPAYPQKIFRDPTGAGDSFAGGFIGYLAKTDDLSFENFKKAIVVGSVMASFNVEDFSLDRLRSLKKEEILSRFQEFKKFANFSPLEVDI